MGIYQIHFCKRMFKNKYSILSTKYSTIELNRPIHFLLQILDSFRISEFARIRCMV